MKQVVKTYLVVISMLVPLCSLHGQGLEPDRLVKVPTPDSTRAVLELPTIGSFRNNQEVVVHRTLEPVTTDLKRSVSDRGVARLDKAHLVFPNDDHSGYLKVYEKLQTILAGYPARLNILHIGGSHVQGGAFTGRVRDDFAAMPVKAVGDRGLVFPFSALRTNVPANYRISYTGVWHRSRCIAKSLDAELGLAGAAVFTTDPRATLTLDLKDKKWGFDCIRVLGEAKGMGGAHPVVVLNDSIIQPLPQDGQSGYLFRLPKEVTRCKVAIQGVNASNRFDLRGMLPMSTREGITYSESGINGASVPSWLKCVKFEEELRLLPPDLVVCAIGVNDASGPYGAFRPERFKQHYRELLAKVLAVNPNCTFIFVTNNDCFQSVHKHVFNRNTEVVAQAFYDLAQEFHGAVFDVYQIMGGYKSSTQWVRAGLMQADHIHFKNTGYQLLGDLLYNAIIEDFLNNGIKH